MSNDREGLIKTEISQQTGVPYATAVSSTPMVLEGTIAGPGPMHMNSQQAQGMVPAFSGPRGQPQQGIIYTQQPGQPVIIYAQDPTAMPSSYPHQMNNTQQRAPPPGTMGPPVGYWRDGICDCCHNLWPSCLCSCCIFHGAWSLSQISQKIDFIQFRYLIIIYFLLFVVTWFIAGAADNPLWLVLPGGAVWLLGIFVRLRFVKHFSINTHGQVLEGLNAICCCCCSIAQMSRHLMGYNKVFDGDSDPSPRDYYFSPAPGGGVVHPNV